MASAAPEGALLAKLLPDGPANARWRASNAAQGEPTPDHTTWGEAEIKSCCRLASLLNAPLVQAEQRVVTAAVTAVDKIETFCQLASGQ